MGTWGPEIFSDDLAADVRDGFAALLEKGIPPADARKRLWESLGMAESAENETRIFWLALAQTQLELVCLEDTVRQKALAIIDSGSSLADWRDSGAEEQLLRQRKAELLSLRERLRAAPASATLDDEAPMPPGGLFFVISEPFDPFGDGRNWLRITDEFPLINLPSRFISALAQPVEYKGRVLRELVFKQRVGEVFNAFSAWDDDTRLEFEFVGSFQTQRPGKPRWAPEDEDRMEALLLSARQAQDEEKNQPPHDLDTPGIVPPPFSCHTTYSRRVFRQGYLGMLQRKILGGDGSGKIITIVGLGLLVVGVWLLFTAEIWGKIAGGLMTGLGAAFTGWLLLFVPRGVRREVKSVAAGTLAETRWYSFYEEGFVVFEDNLATWVEWQHITEYAKVSRTLSLACGQQMYLVDMDDLDEAQAEALHTFVRVRLTPDGAAAQQKRRFTKYLGCALVTPMTGVQNTALLRKLEAADRLGTEQVAGEIREHLEKSRFIVPITPSPGVEGWNTHAPFLRCGTTVRFAHAAVGEWGKHYLAFTDWPRASRWFGGHAAAGEMAGLVMSPADIRRVIFAADPNAAALVVNPYDNTRLQIDRAEMIPPVVADGEETAVAQDKPVTSAATAKQRKEES